MTWNFCHEGLKKGLSRDKGMGSCTRSLYGAFHQIERCPGLRLNALKGSCQRIISFGSGKGGGTNWVSSEEDGE